jgi:hypothetical protein
MTGPKTIDEAGNEQPEVKPLPKHEWGPSRVGHGDAQCTRCMMTNREAWILGPYCIE